MTHQRATLVLLGSALVLLPACGGSAGRDDDDGGSSAAMNLLEVSNGFGQLVPHTIFKLDEDEEVTQEIINIRSFGDLVANLRDFNQVRPVPKFEDGTVLPNGAQGNHFLYARFSQPLDVSTVLDPSPGAQATSGMTGAVTVVALDPITGESVPLLGRAFIDGKTFAGAVGGDPPLLPEQHWVELDETGKPVARVLEDGTQPGLGFPGTVEDFQGADKLLGPGTLVFVADTDGNLATYERFPTGKEIRIRITNAVQAVNGKSVGQTVLGCTTVGPDFLGPEMGRTPPPLNAPLVTPGSGDTDVDPLTTIRVEFTEPVQPLSVGDLDDGTAPILSSSVQLEFGPDATRTQVPFAVRPLSVFDLSAYELIPAFHFPGSGPDLADCATFSQVDISLNPGQIEDLAGNLDEEDEPVPNVNLLGANTFFVTGEGPGLVNAPVSPDTIYVGRSGSQSGISVVDLNGFGGGTGNPDYDPTFQSFEEGDTYFPVNPNVRFQGSLLRPSLTPGTCTVDGGSAGVFTLTKDSALNERVVRPPVTSSVSDMMIGHALDRTFNNAPFPFGCQSGGGNLCALDALKIVNVTRGFNTVQPLQQGQFGILGAGYENIISWAPHPNPPPLVFPPLCVSPYLGAKEPTSVDVDFTLGVFPLQNLLGPGDQFGDPNNGIPPSGLLTPEQNAYFQGPSLPQQTVQACIPHMMRQQIGHFLYVVDRNRGEIVVLNSNRMSVVDRVVLPDPTSLAMGTNLDFLAVTNQLADVVSFVDIDPSSSTFHQVVKTTVVGDAPRGLAWEPDNEDILVTNEGSNSLSIISAFSLEVRKTVSSQLNKPFDVAITPRQMTFGFQRGVYFAYILNRSGRVALYESGPDGVNGWGYDDIIGVAAFTFQNPKAIQPDLLNLNSAVWIAHEGVIDPETDETGPLGEPAVSNMFVESGLIGILRLSIFGLQLPQFRDMSLRVGTSIGPDQLSGIPVDLAFDDQRNLGGEPNVSNLYAAGSPIPANGKNLIRPTPGGMRNASTPNYMFVAVPNAIGGFGVVDVINIGGAGGLRLDVNPFEEGFQSIPASGANVLCGYYRQ